MSSSVLVTGGVGLKAAWRIGEVPQGLPNNLLPFVSQVAIGRRARLHPYHGPGVLPPPRIKTTRDVKGRPLHRHRPGN